MNISSAAITGAQIRLRPATDALRPYVGCFWEIRGGPGARLRMMPDGCATVGVELRDGRRPAWFLGGPLTRASERRLTAPTLIVGVRLRPGVAFLLSGTSVHTLAGRRVSLAPLLSIRGIPLDRQSATTPDELMNIMADFLDARLSGARVQPVVARAIEEVTRTNGRIRVAALAHACGVSPRHLGRLLRVWIGYSPKYLATVMRFQASLTRFDGSRAVRLASVASASGYFDQAHWNRDVSRMAGKTPRHLARHVSDLSKTRCQ